MTLETALLSATRADFARAHAHYRATNKMNRAARRARKVPALAAAKFRRPSWPAGKVLEYLPQPLNDEGAVIGDLHLCARIVLGDGSEVSLSDGEAAASDWVAA